MRFFNWLFRRSPKKIKLGLALGSGGAKGFAELGALRAFEENGLEFDVIAGTSIGSIIGAFYADGYTSNDIYELLKTVDFSEIKSTFMIKMDTAGLHGVLDETIGKKNIEELKKPFMTVATDLDKDEEYVFDKGSVALALSASSCYPPFFKPVIYDDRRLIDGAFTNSIPADLVKKMGADIIVGVDLSTHQPSSGGLLNKLFPTFVSKVTEPWAKGYEYSDVMVHPDLSAYKSISFGAGNEMYDIGYNAAILAIPEIKRIISNFNKKRGK